MHPALYPGYLAYISGAHQGAESKGRYFLGFFVMAGVLSMILALGLLIATLSVSVGHALSVAIPLADLLIITLGILLLIDKILSKPCRKFASRRCATPT